MKALTILMSLAGTQAVTKPAKFLVFLIKDKGAPVLVPVVCGAEDGMHGASC